MDTPESLNPEEAAVPEPAGEEEPLEDEEKLKLQQLAQNQKIRAERAERELKELKKTPKEPAPLIKVSDLSLKDQYALLHAKVHLDDMDEVIDFANLKKISVTEALTSNVIKSILSEREEERASAKASNTAQTKRSSTQLSDEALVEAAARGEFPQKDEDIKRLAEARMNLRVKGLKK